jgi:hypothetical protein
MRVALLGFRYCGKTTLFSALSGIPRDHLHLRPTDEALAAVKIPEPRLDWLEELYKPKKRTEATLEFIDLPGGDEGEHAGLTAHLPALRQADGLLVVVRAFESDAVVPHRGRIDPARDVTELRGEFLLADFVICDNRLTKLDADMKKMTKDRDKLKHEQALLQRCRAALEAEQPLSTVVQAGEEEKMLRSFGFLTQKPVVIAVNVGDSAVGKPPPFRDEHAADTLAVCAESEAELMQVDAEGRRELLAEMGMANLVRDQVVRSCFNSLGMIAFLTAGEEEVRAWPVPRNSTAVEAAGKIHSDLARGFIRAETIAYEDLKAAGNMRNAKAANKVRLEPKGYVVQDGDVMTIKFNV